MQQRSLLSALEDRISYSSHQFTAVEVKSNLFKKGFTNFKEVHKTKRKRGIEHTVSKLHKEGVAKKKGEVRISEGISHAGSMFME